MSGKILRCPNSFLQTLIHTPGLSQLLLQAFAPWQSCGSSTWEAPWGCGDGWELQLQPEHTALPLAKPGTRE